MLRVVMEAVELEVRARDAGSGEDLLEFEVEVLRPALLAAAVEVGRWMPGEPELDRADLVPRLVVTNGVLRMLMSDLRQRVPKQDPRMPSVITRGNRESVWWVRVVSPGYMPEVSASFSPDKTAKVEVLLRKAEWLEGKVVDGEGRPVQSAQVSYLIAPFPDGHIRLDGMTPPRMHLHSGEIDVEAGMRLSVPLCLQVDGIHLTDSGGSFSIPPRNRSIVVEEPSDFPRWPGMGGRSGAETNEWVAVVHPKGMVLKPVQEFESEEVLRLEPWAALEVDAGSHRDVVKGWRAQVSAHPLSVMEHLDFGGEEREVDSDQEPGKWFFPVLPSGTASISFLASKGSGLASFGAPPIPVQLRPGETNRLEVFKGARIVRGRFVLEPDSEEFDWAPAGYFRNAGDLRYAGPLGMVTMPSLPALVIKEQAGHPWSRGISLNMQSDGGFEQVGIPPGEYVLSCYLVEAASMLAEELLPPLPPEGNSRDSMPRSGSVRRMAMGSLNDGSDFSMPNWTKGGDHWFLDSVGGGSPVAILQHEVEVTEEGSEGRVMDLGEIEIRLEPRLSLGQKAPGLEVSGPEGAYDLSNHRGKWVVLCFTTDALDSPGKSLPLQLASWAEELEAGGKVGVVFLNLDAEAPAGHVVPPRSATPGRWWDLGPWSRSVVARDYCVRALPEVVLVNPDGLVAGLHLGGQKLADVLDAISPSQKKADVRILTAEEARALRASRTNRVGANLPIQLPKREAPSAER